MSRKRVVVGELEAVVLNVLWERGDATVAGVVEALPEDRTRHYNTCSTVLVRLEKRGLVARSLEGRVLRFRPLVSREELGREYLSLLKRDLFGGSLREMVTALLGQDRPSARQKRKLELLLEEIEEDPGDA